ncbi:hypothetical protein H2203_000283 [Taxawa tesnikishii (nom. ined.)]|nr:hypothetical protein H2203_000283 [Dothideales sp. JES 119]
MNTVKRRFIRQNRELAKNNSNQSLRIRALECDISRLVAENFSLKEHINALQNELTITQSQISISNIDGVKSQLEEKLREIGTLVAELGSSQQTGNNRRRESLDAIYSAKKAESAGQATRKPRIPLAEATGQEGRLPTIAEDKYYPRRTLDAEEIRPLRLSNNSNESPDLGPPPVAHFEYEDPIKFDPHSMPGDQPASLPAQEDDALPTDLSVNLETRRKRKDGQPKITVRRSSIFATEADESAQQPVRTSAKRKLSAREAEDTGNAGVKDDFRFSRKTTGLNEPDVVEAKKRDENTAIDNAGKEENAPTESARTERRVLGDNGTGRPSRRARAAVNYAEPNLISKMRRPTKEFIPAVIGDSKRAVSTDAKSAVKDRPIRTVIIKREEGTESSWKNLPPAKDEDEPQSPSAQKAHSVAAQRSTSEARIGDDQETIPKSSASGAAISALMSSRRGTVSQATPAIPYEADEAGIGREDEDNEQAMAKRMQEMDLYDFKDSSPADGGQAKAPIKSARRHSSVPKPETAKMGSAAEKESARRHVSAGSVVGVTTGTVQAGRSERAAARRKSMML